MYYGAEVADIPDRKRFCVGTLTCCGDIFAPGLTEAADRKMAVFAGTGAVHCRYIWQDRRE
jgi:hypothetical protein